MDPIVRFLKKKREERGWSVTFASAMTGHVAHETSIRDYEKGKVASPGITQLRALAMSHGYELCLKRIEGWEPPALPPGIL